MYVSDIVFCFDFIFYNNCDFFAFSNDIVDDYTENIETRDVSLRVITVAC